MIMTVEGMFSNHHIHIFEKKNTFRAKFRLFILFSDDLEQKWNAYLQNGSYLSYLTYADPKFPLKKSKYKNSIRIPVVNYPTGIPQGNFQFF